MLVIREVNKRLMNNKFAILNDVSNITRNFFLLTEQLAKDELDIKDIKQSLHHLIKDLPTEIERLRGLIVKDIERVVFHDLLNITWSLILVTRLLIEDIVDIKDIKESLYSSSKILNGELEKLTYLIINENGKLEIRYSKIKSKSFIQTIAQLYKNHEITRGKKIIISDECADIDFFSDRDILEGVIINLLINALEASKTGEDVILGCYLNNRTISFWCRNVGYIPEEAQKKLFKKTYSTKGVGRGIGTYSIKLLTEEYLHGKVNLVSDQKTGTIFTVSFSLGDKSGQMKECFQKGHTLLHSSGFQKVSRF